MAIHLLQHAVLRAAAWPIETTDAFAAPDLAGAAAALLAAERRILDRRAKVVEALHAAVPTTPAREPRAYLLALKRRVHAGSAPLPAPSPEIETVLAAAPALAALVAEEAAARRALADQRGAFARDYQRVLARQRAALRAAAAEPRFQRALAFANPGAFRRWQVAPAGTGATAARTRRAEATVFHYLMRAAGRSTPQGAWAGVAPVAPVGAAADSDGLVAVRAASARCAANVSIQPFAAILQAFTRRPRYRRGYPLRLNPTLFPDGAGWRYERRQADDAAWAVLPDEPVYRLVVGYFADGHARPVEPLLAELEQSAGGRAGVRETLERVVEALLDRDVLCCDLALPTVASNVWDALTAVTPRLVEPERTRWSEAVGRARALCERLAAEFDRLPPAGIDDLRQAIEAEAQALWEWAGLAGTVPRPLVHLDCRVPFEVTWNADQAAAAREAVRALLAFHAADGDAELFRRQSLRTIAEACDGVGEAPLLPLLASGGLGWWRTLAPRLAAKEADPGAAPFSREGVFASRFAPDERLHEQVHARCAAWERLVAPVHHQRCYTLPDTALHPAPRPGPAGAVLLSLSGDGHVWTGWGRPQPGIFATRLADLLSDPPGAEAPMIGALRECAATAARAGVTLAEVIGDDPFNPNAALRPALSGARLEPHGPPETSLRDVRLVLDASGRPWLRRPQAPGWVLPVYNSGATIGYEDACSWLLLTLALGHGWEFVSFGFPGLPAEITRWQHLPRLELPGGAVLSRERWTIDGATVARLAGSDEPTRYLAWRAETERRGLPDLVHVRCGPDAPELLLRTDSPLAIRCLFDTVAARAPWIVVTELPSRPDTWPVRDELGQHYLAELAVTWYADDYWALAPPPRDGDDGAS
jgi:hypothetical protein